MAKIFINTIGIKKNGLPQGFPRHPGFTARTPFQPFFFAFLKHQPYLC